MPFNINLPPWKSRFTPEDTGEMIPPPADPYAQYTLPPPPDFTPAPPAPAPVEEPEMTYPARDALLEYAKGVPQYEKPGVLQRIASGAAGASAGWFQGGGAGYKTGQDVLMTPYRQAVEKWKIGLQPLESAARVEASTGALGARYGNLAWQKEKFGKTLEFQKQKQAALEAWRASKQKSAAYEGNWKFQDFIEPSGVTHNFAFNNKSKQWVEYTDQGEIPSAGPKTGWNEFTERLHPWTTEKGRLAVTSLPRFMTFGPSTQVAEEMPGGLPGKAGTVTWGEDPRTGLFTGQGITQFGKSIEMQPGAPAPPPVSPPPVAPTQTAPTRPVAPPPTTSAEVGAKLGARGPYSEARLTKEDSIKYNIDRIGEMEEIYPRIQKELNTFTGQAKALGVSWTPKILQTLAEKMGVQLSDDLKDFVNISNDLSAEKVKERSGVAFKQWELRWIQKSLPTYDSTNFAGSLRRYKRGLQILMENRGMKSEAELDRIIDKDEGLKTQEQAIPRPWKRLPNGKIAVKYGPNDDDWNLAKPGFVEDEKHRIP